MPLDGRLLIPSPFVSSPAAPEWNALDRERIAEIQEQCRSVPTDGRVFVSSVGFRNPDGEINMPEAIPVMEAGRDLLAEAP